jgi:glycosyltransferase involved in cell wall biosynthesis
MENWINLRWGGRNGNPPDSSRAVLFSGFGMRIIFDGGIYDIQQTGGVNRYFANLIGNLPEYCQPLLIASTRPQELPERSNFELEIGRALGLFSWLKPVDKRGRAKACRRIYAKYRPQVFHPTYYRSVMRNQFKNLNCPLVVTVYDMIHEKFRTEIKHSEKQIKLKKIAVSRADRIICISESTKNDLLSFYNVDEAKVDVIYLASEFRKPAGQGNARQSDYFLFVGGRSEYKNFDVLLRAMVQIKKCSPRLRLKCVGPPFQQHELLQIHSLGLSEQIEDCGRVTDSQLARLYAESIAFIYPSKYEGFGIPLLEAMQCGTPVIASNRSSFPEVIDDAGLLFDPENSDDLAGKMVALVREPQRRESLIEKGLSRAKKFSWAKTASQTVEAYQKAAQAIHASEKAA